MPAVPDSVSAQFPPQLDPAGSVAAIPIPADIGALLDAPNVVHLSTLRRDGSPRNWVVWVGREGDRLLVCTSGVPGKATDMRGDPRVGLSVVDLRDPYTMASLEGRVVELRSDHDSRYMDPIAIKYTSAPFPGRGPHRVCFVIAIEKAWLRRLGFEHNPGRPQTAPGARGASRRERGGNGA